MTWMQLDGGFLYGAHEVDHHHNHEDGLVKLMSLIKHTSIHTYKHTHTEYIQYSRIKVGEMEGIDGGAVSR